MDLLTIITTVLAIAGALGGGTSIAIAVRSRNLITLLKDENAALLGSNTRLDKELEVEKAKLTGIENERNMWRDNVTQAPSIEKLATVTAKQHSEVIGSLAKVVTGLANLTKEMQRERTIK